jgi:nuclear inhibitor of protein phosphatase 1
MEELEKSASSETDGGLLGLPETETELENLTEFNTAHNRRIAMMGIPVEDATLKKRARKIRFEQFFRSLLT